MIDLHMHTVYSDGNSTPDELISALAAQKLEAFAVTDHDTVESLPHVREAAKETGMTVIPGIEINTYLDDQEIHVLGYYIDPEGEALQEVIRQHQENRVVQMQEMAVKLKKVAKVDITYEEIIAISGQGTPGRPHVAQLLINKGAVANMGQAFAKFLSSKCPGYVRRKTVTPHEAVEAIYESGGIPVIAHPGDMENIETLATEMMNYGLRGLEAYHRSHSPALIEFHCSLAEKLDLIVTGGTDFHGPGDAYAKAWERVRMPGYVYDRLKADNQQRQMSMFKAS